MRLLHTSDWHLGKDIGNLDRTQTYQEFLDWLLETIRSEGIDLLIVAGDVFDTTTPPHRIQNLYYSFLARLPGTGCRHAVITAGNHDSPSLISAPASLLSQMGIYAVGAAGDEEFVPIRNADGTLAAVVAAVPYLRERDVFRGAMEQDEQARNEALAAAIGRHYEELVQKARTLMQDRRVPLIATGHLFISGGMLDESVRKLYIGYLGNIPASVFPQEIDYLALGHLHRPQLVQEDERRAYCGSPIALDFSEAATEKSVRIVEFAEDCSCTVRTVPVPAFDRIETISGTAPEILARVEELVRLAQPVIVQVIHTGPSPQPTLAAQVQALTKESPVQIVRTRDESLQRAYLQGEDVNTLDISELTPQSVFSRRLDIASVPDEERAELEKRFEIVLASMQQADPQA
jgi:exonuclease SbcD